jgi:hypothetical protein
LYSIYPSKLIRSEVNGEMVRGWNGELFDEKNPKHKKISVHCTFRIMASFGSYGILRGLGEIDS